MIGLRAGEPGAGDGRVADATAAEHRHAVAPADVAGVASRRRARPSRRSRAARRPPACAAGSTLVAWPAATSVCLGERADAERGRERRCRRPASSSGWRCGWRSSTTGGRAGRPGTSPHTARQLRITKSPGRHVGDVGADRLDDPRGLVAEQEREVVVDRALAVVQVGVAHAARLHGDAHLARPGVGNDDVDRPRPARPSRARRHP